MSVNVGLDDVNGSRGAIWMASIWWRLLLRWVIDGVDEIAQIETVLGVDVEGALMDGNHGWARQTTIVVWVMSWDNCVAMRWPDVFRYL